jgi:hypothetical protein
LSRAFERTTNERAPDRHAAGSFPATLQVMNFAEDLTARSHDRITAIIEAGRGTEAGTGDAKALLQVALVNEI